MEGHELAVLSWALMMEREDNRRSRNADVVVRGVFMVAKMMNFFCGLQEKMRKINVLVSFCNLL